VSVVAEYREAREAVRQDRFTPDEARVGLRETVAKDLEEHGEPEVVLAVLDSLRRKAREEGRSVVEDVVMDVMDYVVGWCNTRMRLLSS